MGTVAASHRRDPGLPEIVWRSGDLVAMVDTDRLRLAISAFIEASAWWGNEGPIRIAGVVAQDRLDVSVEREGTALSAAEAEELFLPRAPGTGGGSKVGLFVARAVARAQGGDVVAEVDDFLRFRLVLPVHADSPAG